ncbi:recombination protein RecR [Thiospirochaeta perfilievii]|uniref:Recombination protein RecR n=1 Tax=Thiospirochaeta perfilievii TaxID=252967 RepID=A0A5C1QDJ1_9SPIO|nr:recombination mediator RecR [Thiospirochaeta perfilievii]QEN04794.1 recombination protein RecR [Thiospirochaeta perfilievii]
MESLDNLISSFSSLPSIGKKSATRLAYFILKSDKRIAEKLAHDLLNIKVMVKNCSQCGTYTEGDICNICSSLNRDKIICVVEQSQDVYFIDSTGEYSGYFHVLNGVLSPLNGVGPKELKLDKLVNRIKEEGFKEVIIATNPTLEGDTTALYILKLLEGIDVKVSRIASGMPVGGDMEYIDKQTLSRSLKGRISY